MLLPDVEMLTAEDHLISIIILHGRGLWYIHQSPVPCKIMIDMKFDIPCKSSIPIKLKIDRNMLLNTALLFLLLSDFFFI